MEVPSLAALNKLSALRLVLLLLGLAPGGFGQRSIESMDHCFRQRLHLPVVVENLVHSII